MHICQWVRAQIRLKVHALIGNAIFGFCFQGLTDDYIFEEAQPILQSLKRQDCKPALDWCHENRVRLKKMKSKLEFRLRTQVRSIADAARTLTPSFIATPD